jgi:hypothetical protein
LSTKPPKFSHFQLEELWLFAPSTYFLFQGLELVQRSHLFNVLLDAQGLVKCSEINKQHLFNRAVFLVNR